MTQPTEYVERLRDDADASAAEDAIWKRMDDAVGRILGIKDRITYLKEEDNRRLRGVVLRELNELADFCVCLLRASDDGRVNEDVLRMLSEIHSVVVR